MPNYDTFNAGNYECSSCKNNYSIGYNEIINSSNHGSYSGKEDYSGEKFGSSDSFEY